MKTLTANPSRYQINTRVWLTELSRAWAAATRLDVIPDGVIAVSQTRSRGAVLPPSKARPRWAVMRMLTG